MNDYGSAIRELLKTGPTDYAMEVLLAGNPREIYAAGLRGVDADAAFSPELIASLEAAGLKAPGRPMTVSQLARALESGFLDENTQIVQGVR